MARWDFDTFRLNVDGQHEVIRYSAEYRFYAGYHMLHHGWMGVAVDPRTQLRLGVQQVPFGLLPYASHNWFFSLPYYLGFEDDYDTGLTLLASRPFDWPFEFQAAFYKNDEGSFSGRSRDSARYSYDVVLTTPDEITGVMAQSNDEVNLLNLRAVHEAAWRQMRLQTGASLQYGGLYNHVTRRMGDRFAFAGHLDGTFAERWSLKLLAMQYQFRPQNLEGMDSRFVSMGAYDAPYKVAASGQVYVVGLAYRIPVSWGPVTAIQLYDDFSWLSKTPEGYASSQMNVLGVMLSAGPVVTYLDLAAGRNHPWLGADYASALAEGNADARWEARVNLNMGLYF